MSDPRYDPLEPDQLADPAPTLAALRRDEPVHRSPDYDLWVLTRHDEVVAAARDTGRFSSRTSTAGRTTTICPEATAILAGTCPHVDTLVTADPPEHALNRRLLNGAFGARAVAALEPFVRGVTADLVDQFAPGGKVDLVAGLASPLPMRVITHVLGFPASQVGLLERWSDDIAQGLSAELSDADQVRVATSTAAFRRFTTDAIADRRQHPQDDLLSRLVHGVRDDGRRLELPELLSLCEQLLVAGNETTTSLISSALWLLLRHPAEMEAVRGDLTLLPGVLEETLRLQAPVQGRYRVAATDIELHGQEITAGERIQLHLGAANRDPAVFGDPDRFDPRRANVRSHLAFGSGPHFCVGAPLARLEARIALETLLARLPAIRLATPDEPRWRRHFHLRGLEALHIEWASEERTH